MVLQGHVTNRNYYTSTTKESMATKSDSTITYLDGLLPIKSHNPLIK